MSGIEEVKDKCWLKLVFIFMCIFIYRNKFKMLPVMTVPSLPFILTGFPAAEKKVELEAVRRNCM